MLAARTQPVERVGFETAMVALVCRLILFYRVDSSQQTMHRPFDVSATIRVMVTQQLAHSL